MHPARRAAPASRERALRASRAEGTALAYGLRTLRAAPVALVPVPVTVISAARSATRREAALRQEPVDAHRDFAAALPYGRHVMAEGSAHMVQQDQPDLVVEEIVRLLR